MQNGTVISNLDILKQVHEPINPRLDLSIIKHFQTLQSNPQTQLTTNAHPPNTLADCWLTNNTSHGNNSGTMNVSQLIYFSEVNSSGYNEPTGGIFTSSLTDTGPNINKDTSEIQNISCIVQQQTPIKSKTNSWVGKDNDEFTDFQSSNVVPVPASNVSITLNPINYFMAPPSSSSEFTFNNLMNPTLPNNSNINSSSKLSRKKETTTFRHNHVDNNEFTDFQSSLDFEVNIKQPNLKLNIKTNNDTKNVQLINDTRILKQKSLDNDGTSVLVGNVPLKTKTAVLNTMRDERNPTMYQTNVQDYLALKAFPNETAEIYKHDSNRSLADVASDFSSIVCNNDLARQNKDLLLDSADKFTELEQAVPLWINNNSKEENTEKDMSYFEGYSNLKIISSLPPSNQSREPLANGSTYLDYVRIRNDSNNKSNKSKKICRNRKNDHDIFQFSQVTNAHSYTVGLRKESSGANPGDLAQKFEKNEENNDVFSEFEQAPKFEESLEHEDSTVTNKIREPQSETCEDKYSALRALEFLYEDTEDKDPIDGDPEDKDRLDGDNLSLQLPCVDTQDQDSIQVCKSVFSFKS